MSAPKPELTVELRAIAERLVHDVFPSMDSQCAVRYIQQAESLVREVVAIVAPSETVVRALKEYREVYCFDDSEYGKAIDEQLARWGLK